jgi:hypothetical protein
MNDLSTTSSPDRIHSAGSSNPRNKVVSNFTEEDGDSLMMDKSDELHRGFGGAKISDASLKPIVEEEVDQGEQLRLEVIRR